ncbi:MAG: hypothetical protein R3C05_24850 [Pirellulaceae bacterium]
MLSTLRNQIRKVETARQPQASAISSGVSSLDDVLPQKGYPPGSLVEWIDSGQAGGAAWLSLLGAARAYKHSGNKVVILDPDRTFYPPAAIACGLPAEAMILLQPQSSDDLIWAMDQSLRSSAVSAVWGKLDRLEDIDARRLQLAAETGGTLGMLLRPAKAIGQPSWAEVRWHVHGVPAPTDRTSPWKTSHGDRLLSVRLLRARGASAGEHFWLQIDPQSRITRRECLHDSKSAQHLAAELAHPKAAGRRQQARRA